MMQVAKTPHQSLWNSALAIVLVLITGFLAPLYAEIGVAISVGPEAPAIEKKAARELQRYLRSLFDAKATFVTTPGSDVEGIILVGSPATNPAVKAAGAWPSVSDQGIVIRNVQGQASPTLIVGGGSPVATLWAAYELVHQYGVRYFLHGDLMPLKPGTLRLSGFDTVMEPNLRTRTWRTLNVFAIGPESWDLAEHKRVLQQLAKQKYNRLMLALHPWQPFIDYSYKGVKKSTAELWFGYRYPMGGDVASKQVFGGAKEFIHPEFKGADTYQKRVAVGTNLARQIIATAKELGMSTIIAISPTEFPREFAAVLPGAKSFDSLNDMLIGPGSQQTPEDPNFRGLVAAKIRAYIETYPEIDALDFTLPEMPQWTEHFEAAWKRLDEKHGVSKTVQLKKLLAQARNRDLIASGDRGVSQLQGNIVTLDFLTQLLEDKALLQRPDGSRVQPVLNDIDPALFPLLDKIVSADTGFLHFIDYTARRIVANRQLIPSVPPSAAKRSSLILTLADDNVGILPQITLQSIHVLLQSIREAGWDGFSTRYWLTGELDPAIHYLARASFDASVTPSSAYDDLYTPICGEGTHQRVAICFEKIEKATEIIDKNAIGFAFPVPGMLMKHYRRGEVPNWLQEVKPLYNDAMIEAFRAIVHSEVGGRPAVRFQARRLASAVNYLAAVEAVCLAGAAKKAGDRDQLLEQLDTAAEAMYEAIDQVGELTHDSCGIGLIAVMNAYGYQAVVKELEAQETAVEGQ